MITTLSELKEQLNSISEQIKQLESPKFEAGKWYNVKTMLGHDFLFNYQKTECGKFHGFGFNCLLGRWFNDALCYLDGVKNSVLATHSEVETALINEAKKRYKVPCKIAYLDRCAPDNLTGYELMYDSKKDALYATEDIDAVYKQGQWAEIIKEDKIEIGGHEVFIKGKEGLVTIGCKTIYQIELQQISDLMRRCDFNIIQLDEYKTNLETINKILSKL